MKKFTIGLLLLISIVLSAGIPTQLDYHGPTEQLIKRETWERIESKLIKMNVPLELIPYFNAIASLEDWGHIGYHGANQKFRVYQDVIRFTVEELLAIPIREDFHFIRVPGDPDLNLQTKEEFFEYWGKKIDNKNEMRSKQLLALNFGIYSNFDVVGSCSVSFFVNDISKTKIDYAKQLFPFYTKLGITSDALYDLFEIATKWLDEDAGILLQISENSHLDNPHHEAFNYADQLCYPSKKGGFIHGSGPISSHYERVMTPEYTRSDLDIAPQIRLILSNQYSLNPFTPLIIRRWDLYNDETIKGYEAEMRAYIRNLNHDPELVKKYREFLLDTWL